MYKFVRNLKTVSKSPFQCACYSTLKQPIRKESEETPKPANSLEPAENAKEPETKPKIIDKNVSVENLKPYDPYNVSKEDMKWRTTWHQKEAPYYNALRSFYTEESKVDMLKTLQTPIDLRPATIKKWWLKRKEYREMMLQSYLPERHQTLGSELAAAHFIVHRGGAVKFYHQDKWIKADDRGNYNLPRHFEKDRILQAIDCSDMNLYYEGLSNLSELKQVEWLSFNGVENFDDWFLDRISNMFSHSLIYLDIRNCPNYTERGLGALYKMENLKMLYIDDMLMTTPFEMTCLLLQEINLNLDIKVGY